MNGPADAMQGAYLGPEFSPQEIEERLWKGGARLTILGDGEVIDATADALVGGKAVGWFQGRMRFGPRARGGRSVLREDVAEWFDPDADTPYIRQLFP